MKKYNVIYADPPWDYKNKTTGRTNGSQPEGSGAGRKYETTDLKYLKSLPVKNVCQENAVCFIWGTVPLLPEALELLKAWGFTYKTKITWEKTGLLGMGHWLRIQEEFILVGIIGDVKPFRHQERNIFRHPISQHSAKPHFFRELVVKLTNKIFENPQRLEMFARSRSGMFSDYEYEGWDVYGNEVNNSIDL